MLVALAALCWGISGGIGGILMADGWDPYVVSFYRGAIGLLVVIVWLALCPHRSGWANRRLWFWSAIAGLGVAGNFAFYFVSIAQGTLAVAATLMYCAPVFVYLISFALRLERVSPLKWSVFALAILGIVLLTRIYDTDTGGVTPSGITAGLFAGLSYAVFIFGFKYAAPHGSPQAILVIAFAVLVTLLAWPLDLNRSMAVLSSADWPLIVVLGLIGAGLSFFLYIVGLRHTTPTTASIVAMLEPVTASLFGFIVLDETLRGWQIVGMGLILVSATVLSVYSNSRPHASSTSTL